MHDCSITTTTHFGTQYILWISLVSLEWHSFIHTFPNGWMVQSEREQNIYKRMKTRNDAITKNVKWNRLDLRRPILWCFKLLLHCILGISYLVWENSMHDRVYQMIDEKSIDLSNFCSMISTYCVDSNSITS